MSAPRVLCLCAHPDDEFFCAGLLAQLSRHGCPIHLVYLTRGESGMTGPVNTSTASTTGELREAEANCSAQVLRARTLSFLDYVDPPPDQGLRPPELDPNRAIAKIQALMHRYDPTVVLTHGSDGDYGHPAHRLLHRLSVSAIDDYSGPAPSLYSFNAFHPSLPQPGLLEADDLLNKGDWADLIVDVSSLLPLKAAVLLCHRTQWPVFVGEQPHTPAYKSAIAEYMQAYSVESYTRHRSPSSSPPNCLASCLRRVPDIAATFPADSAWDSLHRWTHRSRRWLKTQVHRARARLSALQFG